jgi:glycosyltransferase involved in cell wall biosynthesis
VQQYQALVDVWRANGTRHVALAHPEWLGILNAAKTTAEEVVTSNHITPMDAGYLMTACDMAGVRNLVIHGGIPGYEYFFAAPPTAYKVRRHWVFHGSPGAGAGHVLQDVVDKLRKFKAAGFGVGVVQSRFAEYLGIPWVPNRLPTPPAKSPEKLPGINIGLFVTNVHSYKNFDLQMFLALDVAKSKEGVKVHVLSLPSWWENPSPYQHQVRAHAHPSGKLSTSKLRTLLGQMTVNLHATYTESHALTPLESIMWGTPVVASTTCGTGIQHAVDDASNIVAIRRVLDVVLADPKKALEQQTKDVHEIDTYAKFAWSNFLSAP